MKVNGQLEEAGLEQLTGNPSPAFTGRAYMDITAGTGAGVPKVYNGTSWLNLMTAYQTTSYDLLNVGLAISVGSSALTIRLKQGDGATDPSAASPCYASFRDSTLASGLYAQVAATAATSLVVPSGATLGMASGVAGNLWVYLINNAGTIELAVSGVRYDEGTTQSSTTISSGATSTSTIYSTTGRTGKAIRLIGRVNISEATAGAWVSLPTAIALAPLIYPGESVYMSSHGATTSLPNNASFTAIVMANLEEDSHNGFSSGIYTVQKTGRYLVSAGYTSGSSITSPSVGNFWQLALYKNGSGIRLRSEVVQTTSTINFFSIALSAYINCSVGDTIQPYGAQNVGTGSMVLNGGNTMTFFQVMQMP